MKKIILKYLVLIIPVIAAIILLNYQQKEETDEEALQEVIESEYIVDLSQSDEGRNSTWGDNREGSAKFLSGRTGIITFFVGDSTTKWTKSDIQTVCSKLNVAAGYLAECGRKYDQQTEFIYNMQDMMFYEQSDELLSKWEDTDYTHQVYNWIDKDVNCEFLLNKYDLDGLAFMIVLNKPGVSYAVAHKVEDEKSNYYECAYIYLFDSEYPDRYESPASYAHELLHLFGAVDLYSGSENRISKLLESYVKTNYPNEIMYTTYLNGTLSVSSDIEQEFSEVTAYEVGFLSNAEVLEQFPELKKTYPACFSDKDKLSNAFD